MAVVEFLFYTLFPTLLDLIQNVFSFFSTSLRDLILRAFEINLPDWAFLDLSLFSFALGSGLILFFGLTLVKWFIDIIT